MNIKYHIIYHIISSAEHNIQTSQMAYNARTHKH